jgi:arylformamidase
MKIHDVTLTLAVDMPVWPGGMPVVIEWEKRIEEGANSNDSRMEIGIHTGTHVDAPYHFLKTGNTVETLPLETLIGKTMVVELSADVDEITREAVERLKLPDGVERILFKTRNSQYWIKGLKEFQKDFVGIDAGAAQLLVEKGVRLVGIDYLSIAPFKSSRPTHEILLKAKTVIIEGLDLSGVNAGEYTMHCLPLKIHQSEGAPARVILIED